MQYFLYTAILCQIIVKKFQKLLIFVKICCILKEPDNKVCMDKRQIQQLFADTICIKSGYMEVYGYQNTKDAQETLESSGFMIEPVNF